MRLNLALASAILSAISTPTSAIANKQQVPDSIYIPPITKVSNGVSRTTYPNHLCAITTFDRAGKFTRSLNCKRLLVEKTSKEIVFKFEIATDTYLSFVARKAGISMPLAPNMPNVVYPLVSKVSQKKKVPNQVLEKLGHCSITDVDRLIECETYIDGERWELKSEEW